MANVWVPAGDCGLSPTNSNRSCMELTLSNNYFVKSMPIHPVHWIPVQVRKGMIGMVLASENKSCFCLNSSEFSIDDQPTSHYDMLDRRDVCFAICLQSSDIGNLVYVMEFFLYQGPATHMYVGSFLSLLLPIIEHELISFKLACGKQLGEELVVEVIEFSDANKLDSSELEPVYGYPVIFKSVQYNQKGCHPLKYNNRMSIIIPKKNNTQENAMKKNNMQKKGLLVIHISVHEKERRENPPSILVVRFSNHILGRS